MANKIIFQTITEHLTPEECETLTVKEVIDRKGFQTLRLVQMKSSTKDEQPLTLVAIQSVEMVDIETNADADSTNS